ncbi:YacL family protein [Shewanella sp. 202IG2-18]|uniref:YacL family protein n=1 Tax=Parashewanella hymeniacidonis TaxID=2807618 RepID=UPI00195F96C2|nr:YacL family protein [Parashewanella hymeniacidonis]MBM7071306.1 YacL family protein [Parashewanella hymeniacidonis]
MDFEFRRNTLDDGVVAIFSMEHQVLGRWFTEELSNDKVKLADVKSALESVCSKHIQEWRSVGREISLEINSEQVTVFENSLNLDDELEELEQGFNLYSAESFAYCGFEDFQNVLESFEDFIR